MLKSALLLAFMLLVQVSAVAQNPYKRKIMRQGKEMAEATISGNYQALAKFTYPRIIEIMGGQEQMSEIIEKEIEQLESQGITLVSVKLGTPEKIFKAANELHCLVPQTIVLKLNAGNMAQESFLLAVSQDAGKKWYFVDTAQLTNDSARQLFPAFNQDLKIPAPKEPVFVDEE